MTTRTGGTRTTMKTMKQTILILTAISALAAGTPALAANDGGDAPEPVTLFKGFALAAIEVAKEAAQATSDTVHHNLGNVMGTAAKARGFVRDSVGGVLGNARKLSGMVGDMMPLTTHNHYEAAPPTEKNENVPSR